MYEAPRIQVVGSFAELTQSNIYKKSGGTDVVYVNGVEVGTIPGTVTSYS